MKYFKLDEFDSPDEQGSGIKMNQVFLSLIDKARDMAGTPFKISSGYRTMQHNIDVGGVNGSSHTLGLAADIVCSSSREREEIVSALHKVGFNRIGISNNFIHCDIDNSKPIALWLYQ